MYQQTWWEVGLSKLVNQDPPLSLLQLDPVAADFPRTPSTQTPSSHTSSDLIESLPFLAKYQSMAPSNVPFYVHGLFSIVLPLALVFHFADYDRCQYRGSIPPLSSRQRFCRITECSLHLQRGIWVIKVVSKVSLAGRAERKP